MPIWSDFWMGSASVYLEQFGTNSDVYTRLFWIQSGTDSKLDLYWVCYGLVLKQSSVNRRPVRSHFQTHSIWIHLELVLCKHSLG